MTTHKIDKGDWTDYVSDVARAGNQNRDGSKKELVYIPPRKEKGAPPDWAVRVVVGDITGREPSAKKKVFSSLLYKNEKMAECHGITGYVQACEEAKRLHEKGYEPKFIDGQIAADVGLSAFLRQAGNPKSRHRGGDADHFARLGMWSFRPAELLESPPAWFSEWLEVRKQLPFEQVLCWRVPGVTGECALEVDAARLLRGSKPAASGVDYLVLNDSIKANNPALKFITKEEALAA